MTAIERYQHIATVRHAGPVAAVRPVVASLAMVSATLTVALAAVNPAALAAVAVAAIGTFAGCFLGGRAAIRHRLNHNPHPWSTR